MKWILVKTLLLVMASTTHGHTDNVYSVWNENGIHLIMSDNSTPTDFSDDWIVDYEDNRIVKVTMLDN